MQTRVFVMLVLLVGCRKTAPAEPAPVVVEDAALVATVVDAESPVDAAAAQRAKDEADYRAYKIALDDGRVATAAKDYPAALRAFDRALTHAPDDARAISERGYAKLLAKDLAGAREDLRLAESRVDSHKDRALHAQIAFNLGLIAEAQGDDGTAFDSFRRCGIL